jgi:hypothetical protein
MHAVLLLLALPCNLLAQETGTQMIPEKLEGKGDGAGTGWTPVLKVAANGSLGQASSVPGTPDGTTVSLGYLITGKLGYLDATRKHEWQTELEWKLSFARTPVIDAWTKSVDGIDLKSAYLFHIKPWLGPFVALRMTTPMLPGYLVPAAATNVLKLGHREEQLFDETGVPVDEDGSVIDATHPRVSTVGSGKQIELTGAFSPLLLRQSLGAFALPVDKPQIRVDIRAGLGVWETFVHDGYAVADNSATADLFELRQMRDTAQLGPEAGIIASGALGSMINYGLGFLFMYPVWNNADTDLKGADLINLEFEAKIGIKPVSWASIDYSFSAIKRPLVVDDWQMQNNLLLSIAFTLFGEDAAPPPPCVCPQCPAVTAPVVETPPPPPADAPEAPAPAAPVPAPEGPAAPAPTA